MREASSQLLCVTAKNAVQVIVIKLFFVFALLSAAIGAPSPTLAAPVPEVPEAAESGASDSLIREVQQLLARLDLYRGP